MSTHTHTVLLVLAMLINSFSVYIVSVTFAGQMSCEYRYWHNILYFHQKEAIILLCVCMTWHSTIGNVYATCALYVYKLQFQGSVAGIINHCCVDTVVVTTVTSKCTCIATCIILLHV